MSERLTEDEKKRLIQDVQANCWPGTNELLIQLFRSEKASREQLTEYDNTIERQGQEMIRLQNMINKQLKELEEAQQDLKLSKQLIELDTEAMNKDLVTISRLKKIANDALGCMVIMSAADNEHVQRIKSGLEALGE